MASTDALRELAPESYPEAAEMLRQAADGGGGVQIHGGATKLGWGRALREPFRRLSTGRLDRVIEHNQGDFTAIVQAGVRLDELQQRLRASGQRVSLDPPTGDGRATIGGIAATADAGPLRHRYGTPRDPVVAATEAGRPALLEIDLQGARQVRPSWPEARFVFLAPPSWEELQRRLVGRGTETPAQRERRLQTAQAELDAAAEFDAVVVNVNVEQAVEDLVALMGL